MEKRVVLWAGADMTDKKRHRNLRLANAFDNIISRGFIALVVALFIAAMIVILVAGAAYLVFNTNDEFSAVEAFWTAFAYTTNPQLPPFGELSDVVAFAVITFIIVVIGLILTSSLIGIITNALSDYYEGLQRGYSPVIEEGHFVIIGFNDMVNTLVDELTLAFPNKEHWCLVFIDDMINRKEMEQRLENYLGLPLKKFQKQQGCKIICRSGHPHNTEDLRRYAVDRARAVIINNYEDQLILKSLLAVSSLLRMSEYSQDPEKQPAIVCAFKDEQYAAAARCVGNERNLRVLSLSSTLADIIAKTCYQPGLSRIITDVFDFTGSEFYMKGFPTLTGRHFDEITTLFGSSVPIGICRQKPESSLGIEVIVNKPTGADPRHQKEEYEEQMTLRESDRIVFLAKGMSEVVLGAKEVSVQLSDDYTYGRHHSSRETNRILVLGYDESFDTTVLGLEGHYSRHASGLDDTNCYIKLVYRPKRESRVMASRLRFLDGEFAQGIRCAELDQSHGFNNAMEKIKDIQLGTTQIAYQCARQDYFELKLLESILLSGEDFNHIVVLSDLSSSKEDADTETLLTLLYLRAITESLKAGEYGETEIASFNITSEIQNVDNINLAYNEYVSDYIISWKFVASLQAQIATNKDLYELLRDILKSGRADIRLEPVTRFVNPQLIDSGGAVDLDVIAQLMRSVEEISEKRLLLGYMRNDGSYVLNPDRDSQGRRLVELGQEDSVIVLAND